MPKITAEESMRRRDEIVDSCAKLYRTCEYRDITMAQVAQGVSFGRANLYNYFRCKDEIMLALLQREHERWADDLDSLAARAKDMDDNAFAHALAQSLAPRDQMLKLLAMNLYDMEQGSRPECLVDLKQAYGRALSSLRGATMRAKPCWDDARTDRFVYAFMPFLHGVHPYVHHTEKQLQAMQQVGIAEPGVSAPELVESLALQLLKD